MRTFADLLVTGLAGFGCLALPRPGAAAVLSVPADYPNIQSAIDAAVPGDTVLVADGTYTGTGFYAIDFRGKSIVVRSEHGPESTILDASWNGHGVRFATGEPSSARLDGFTITRAYVSEGAGAAIRCSNGSSPTIANCVLVHNWASGLVVGRGAGVAAFSGASPTMIGCTFSDNTAEDDSGGDNGAGFYCVGATATLIRCVLYENSNDDVTLKSTTAPVIFECCLIGRLTGAGDYEILGGIWSDDPLFCVAGVPPEEEPADPVDYRVASDSRCMPENNSCGQLIGALETPGCIAGACCFDDGHCEFRVDSHCLAANGLFAGEGVPCDPIPCDPSGGCCLPNGQCVIFTESVCAENGGDYQADGSDCAPHPCPPLTVLPNGTGDHPTIQAALDAAGTGAVIELGDGVFRGDGNRDLDFSGKAVTLRSASGDPYRCTIDCEGSEAEPHRAFDFHSREDSDSRIEGITMTGGFQSKGGAIKFSAQSFPTVVGCIFRGNVADYGGAFYLVSYSYVQVFDSVFEQNIARIRGGAIDNDGDWGADVSGCTFRANEAPLGSAIASVLQSDRGVENSVLSFGRGGAAIYDDDESSVTLTCTNIFGNDGGDWVGDIATQKTVRDNLSTDPLFCDFASDSVLVAANSPCLASNNSCGIQIGAEGEGCASLSTGACCLSNGDCVISSEPACQAMSGLVWQGPGTSCDPNPCPTAGACCFEDGHCEFLVESLCSAVGIYQGTGVPCDPQPCPGFLVLPDGSGYRPTIQEAIDAVGVGAVIELGNGVFTGPGNRDLDYRGKSLILRSRSGDPDSCIIDCQASASDPHRGFHFQSGEDSTAMLMGVTITGGHVLGGSPTGGGAIRIAGGSSPTFANCVFHACTGSSGGAIYCRDEDSAPVITGCIFSSNTATMEGGGLTAWIFASPSLRACTFVGNHCTNGSSLSVKAPAHITVRNTILSFGGLGAPVYCVNGHAEVDFVCSDVFGHGGGDWVGCIADQANENDNFSADPRFCDSAEGDLRLASDSPCLPENSPCGQLVGARDEGCLGTTGAPDPASIPNSFTLSRTLPNPAIDRLSFTLRASVAERADLVVYSVDGSRVFSLADRTWPAGDHRLEWDLGREQDSPASGLYFLVLTSRAQKIIRPILIVH